MMHAELPYPVLHVYAARWSMTGVVHITSNGMLLIYIIMHYDMSCLFILLGGV